MHSSRSFESTFILFLLRKHYNDTLGKNVSEYATIADFKPWCLFKLTKAMYVEGAASLDQKLIDQKQFDFFNPLFEKLTF